MAASSVWPILHDDDSRAALGDLVDVFEFHELVVAADDVGDIAHVEHGWPGNGVLVFGSTKHVDTVHGAMQQRACRELTSSEVDVAASAPGG